MAKKNHASGKGIDRAIAAARKKLAAIKKKKSEAMKAKKKAALLKKLKGQLKTAHKHHK